ncbi:hypothetical protein BST61_g2517 [Cercospora zeina]
MSNSRGSTIGGPFYVHIEGLPPTYTWQDLKDLIKNRARHGLWADMMVAPGRPTGAGVGYARLERPDEALQLYHWLAYDRVENRALTVHLWDISDARRARFVQCNCGRSSQCAQTANSVPQRMAMSLQWQPLTPVMPIAAPFASPLPLCPSGPQLPALVPSGAHFPQSRQHLAAARYQFGNSPQNHAYLMQLQNAAPLVSAPRPARTAAGLPVNTSNGTFPTESRGVYVSGLPCSAGEKEIKQWFGQVGRIVEFRLKIDKATKKWKGNCTIQYSSATEAQEAINEFDGTKFMEMKLLVRLDKVERPTMQPAQPARGVRSAGSPTIVDGSRAYTRQIMA